MARRLHIFVDSELNLEDFAKRVSELSGLELQLVADQYERWYEAQTPQFLLDLGDHSFDNDKDMNFENYRYDIRIKPLNITKEEDWQKSLETIVCPIYEKLKATDQYSLMLVDDLQAKLDEFKPPLTVHLPLIPIPFK